MVMTSNPGLPRKSKVHAGLAAVRQSNEMASANILFDIAPEHTAAGAPCRRYLITAKSGLPTSGGACISQIVLPSGEPAETRRRSDTSRRKIFGDVGRYAFRLYFLLAIAHWSTSPDQMRPFCATR